jgi:glycosyltransferase involved in cell wall biosynthesis
VNGFAPRWLARQGVGRTKTSVIAASQFVACQFQSAARESIRVIYNGSADYRASPRTFTASKPRIGILGRIAPEKGQLDFVRAARLLADSATFTIYGASLFSDPAYARQVKAEAEHTPVVFQDWREDVGSIYRDLDILAVPSFEREASTRVIMEAFSAGVPVVAYPSGGIPEIVAHGRTGLLTQSSDSEALAATLQQLLADRNQMERLSLEGRAEWKMRFTRAGFQNAICEVIESRARVSQK